MPRSTRLERVRGTNDILPPAAAQHHAVEAALLHLCAAYGYRRIAVPVLEYPDLYLRKAGEDTLARLYTFTYQNRRLSLRPELTASVVRAVVEHMQTAPLPLRLCYSGPVFRYETPQRSRYRQFTQVGLELIGAAGAAADAEVMAVALRGLEAVGVHNYRVVIGHIGVLSALLRCLDLDERLMATLVAGMETLMDAGSAPLRQRLAERFPEWVQADAPLADDDAEDARALTVLLQNLGEERARTAVLELLGAMNVGLEGSRSREEIVDRVLAKFSRARRRPQIERALALMEELGRIKGPPDAALAAAQVLLEREQASTTSLDSLRQTLQSLDAYHPPWERIGLDFALSRGLQYYTGLLFEVYHEGPGGERQLCGGGRYDDLVAALGSARDLPACGFAYGLERVLLALETEGRLPCADDLPTVLVVPVEPTDQAYAVETADLLRAAGLAVELDVKGRGVKGSLQHANRAGVPVVVIVGSEERAAGSAVVRHMAGRREERVPLCEIGSRVSAILRERVDSANG